MAGSNHQQRVERCPWETRFEWQCRCKFVHDFSEEHGFDKATSLSMLWANMAFLGCRYPNETEQLVAGYPTPHKTELTAWLRDHGYSETYKEAHNVKPQKRRSSDSVAPPSKRSAGSPISTAEDFPNSSSEESIPFETLTEQLDFLISSIRHQQEASSSSSTKDGTEHSNFSESDAIIEKLAQKCICSHCNSGGGPHPTQILLTLCGRHKMNIQFVGSTNEKYCISKIFINDIFMAEDCSEYSKKEAKRSVAENLLKKISSYQAANWKPPCYSSSIWSRVGERRPSREVDLAESTPDVGERPSKSLRLGDRGMSDERELAYDDSAWHSDHMEDRERENFSEELCPGGRINERKHSEGREAVVNGGIRERLLNFIDSDSDKLVFTADLLPEDQQIVSLLCEQHLLKHSSYGSTGNRHIITKRMSSLPSEEGTERRPTYPQY